MIKNLNLPFSRGLQILGIGYGLCSNNHDLIFNSKYFEHGEIYSILTNWYEIEHTSYKSDLDATCYFLDDPSLPFEITKNTRELFVQGDLSRIDGESQEPEDEYWHEF